MPLFTNDKSAVQSRMLNIEIVSNVSKLYSIEQMRKRFAAQSSCTSFDRLVLSVMLSAVKGNLIGASKSSSKCTSVVWNTDTRGVQDDATKNKSWPRRVDAGTVITVASVSYFRKYNGSGAR